MGKVNGRLGLHRETVRSLGEDASGARGGETGSAATCAPLHSCPLSCFPGGCGTQPLTVCFSNLETTCTI